MKPEDRKYIDRQVLYILNTLNELKGLIYPEEYECHFLEWWRPEVSSPDSPDIQKAKAQFREGYDKFKPFWQHTENRINGEIRVLRNGINNFIADTEKELKREFDNIKLRLCLIEDKLVAKK